MVDQVLPEMSHTYKKRKMQDGGQPPCNVIVTSNPSYVSRGKYNNVANNKEERKQYRVAYDKRVILEYFDTIPYGYL